MSNNNGKNQKSESQLAAEALAIGQPTYGPVRFGIPTKRTVSDRFNRVSVKMLDAIVSVPTLGISLVCAMYAGLERKGDGVSIVPTAYVPGKVIVPDAEGATDALAAHIENAAINWAGYEGAYVAAAAALMGHAEPGQKIPALAPMAVQRPVLARLVKPATGEVVATAAVAAGR